MLVQDLIITEIIIPVVERDQFHLYKATPLPIHSPHGRMIAFIQSPYFLLNSKHTEFIPLSKKELDYGIRITSSSYLFKPSASIQLNYESICPWRVFSENDLIEALSACNMVPIVSNDIVLTIIEHESYFISASSNIKIWENCDENTPIQHEFVGRAIINLSSDCSIQSKSFIVKPHRMYVYNQTKTVTPSITALDEVKLASLNQLIQTKTINFSIPRQEQIFIHDESEMENLIHQSDILATHAKYEFKTENLAYENQLFTMLFSVAMFAIALIGILICAYLAYTKFTGIASIFRRMGIKSLSKSNEPLRFQMVSGSREAVASTATPGPIRRAASLSIPIDNN